MESTEGAFKEKERKRNVLIKKFKKKFKGRRFTNDSTLVTFSQVSSSDKTAIEEWISPQ